MQKEYEGLMKGMAMVGERMNILLGRMCERRINPVQVDSAKNETGHGKGEDVVIVS